MKSATNRFRRARCRFCGTNLHPAWIPNRGNVMAHERGMRERCDRMLLAGTDMISRAKQSAEKEANHKAFLAKLADRQENNA